MPVCYHQRVIPYAARGLIECARGNGVLRTVDAQPVLYCEPQVARKRTYRVSSCGCPVQAHIPWHRGHVGAQTDFSVHGGQLSHTNQPASRRLLSLTPPTETNTASINHQCTKGVETAWFSVGRGVGGIRNRLSWQTIKGVWAASMYGSCLENKKLRK